MLDADVQYFIELARHRSMAQAADDLAVSQSTLSRAIQRLEARFGVELVERTSCGVALTDAGNRLIARLESAVSHLQDAQHELLDIARGRRGMVRVAVGHTVSSPVVRALVPRLRKERPAANLVLDAWYNHQIIPKVMNAEYEFGVCVIPDSLPAGLQARTLLRDHLVPVVRKGHPLARQRSPVAAHLLEYPWVGAGRRVLSGPGLQALFVAAGVDPPVHAVVCSSLETAIDAVRSSDCLCFAPDWLVHENIGLGAGLSIVRVPGFALPRVLGILTRREGHLSPLTLRARELVVEALSAVEARLRARER